MSARALEILRALAGASLVVFGTVSVANAQVRPSPPTDIFVDGGTQVGGGHALFFDDFNYVVGKNDPGGWGNTNGSAWVAFTSHGWHAVKRNPTDSGAGFIYTTTSIPGYSGQMPGLSGSGRVLCLEAKPTSLGLPQSGVPQTDFYLQYGRPNSTDVPADVWYQFWFFILDQPGYASRFSAGNKLIYPSPNGSYGVPTGTVPYMINLSTNSYETNGQPAHDLGYGSSLYVQNRPEYSTTAQTGADFLRASEYPTNRSKLGTSLNRTGGYMSPNRWYLIKIHVDHATVQGKYEVWHRELGGMWQKTTEWLGGVTPNFFWPTIPAQRAGISTIRIPTTWGRAAAGDTTNYDAWTYMADFAIATRESDLPVYTNY